MEKRTFFAFLLIIGFFLVWTRFAPEQDLQPTVQEDVRDERVTKPSEIRQAETKADKAIPLAQPRPSQDILEETKINDFYITYSPQGGYIYSIALNTPENLLPFRNFGFQAAVQDVEFKASVRGNSILFTREGLLSKKFTFGEHLIEIEGVSESSPLLFSVSLNEGVSRLGQRYLETFYQTEESLVRAHPKKVDEKPQSDVGFAGARSKYYTASLLTGRYNIEWQENDQSVDLYLHNPSSSVSLYVGPQTKSKLEPYGLEGIIYYGFWHFLAVTLIWILSFFHGFLHNWGWSIILFALSACFILFPFTSKGYKSTMETQLKMQEVQPLLKKIREKYKDNPHKLNKEMMNLYKKHNINPLGSMGGCLPLLIFQTPIFIAFYQVVYRFPELKGANFLWIRDLAMPDRLFRFPFATPLFGIEYFNLLPVLLMVLGIVQQRITTGSANNPQQKKMGLFMGVFMGVIFYNFPAALVLYFFVHNLFTLGYQARLKKLRAAQTN